jgi:HPt (histidine-containing phosphotransfer) domain-containing protein
MRSEKGSELREYPNAEQSQCILFHCVGVDLSELLHRPSQRPSESLSAEQLSALRSALSSNDPKALADAAHRLKGDSALMGASTVSGLCAQLETLLVEAYVVLWLILMGWLYITWRRQSALSAQLDDLEKTIDKAAAASKKPEKK